MEDKSWQELAIEQTQKEIIFDLDTNILKKEYRSQSGKQTDYTNAYSDICSFLEKNGFDHDQRSAYTSIDLMKNREVVRVLADMFDKFPWLDASTKEMRVTLVLGQYDPLKDVKEIVALAQNPTHREELISTYAETCASRIKNALESVEEGKSRIGFKVRNASRDNLEH